MRIGFLEWLILYLLLALVVALVILLGFLIYQTAFSEKITLLKNDWHCSDTKVVMRNQLVGKILVPTPTKICIQYNRK